MAQRRFFEAVLLFSEAIACDPGRAINFIKRCTCSIELGQYKQAVADALNAIKLDKHMRLGYYRLIDCYLAMGDLDSTENALETFLRIVPKARMQQAAKLMKLRDLKTDIDAAFSENQLFSCIELIDEALVIAPACPDLRFLKARCFAALNKFGPIDQNFVDPKIVKMLKLYYNGEFLMGFIALQSLTPKSKILMALESTFIQIIDGFEKAEKLVDQKNNVAAIDKLQSMIAIDKSNKVFVKKVHWKTASAHFADKRFVVAIKFADQSLEIDGNFHEATILKAESYFELRNYQRCIEECEKVLQSAASTLQKDVVLQLKSRVEVAMKSQEGVKIPPKASASENCKSTYSTEDVKKEKVDNSQFFASFNGEDVELPRRQSNVYSYSSADSEQNPHFRECFAVPRKKSETKTSQQIQDENRAQQMNQQGNKEFLSGRFDSAIECYSDAIAILPKYPIFYNNRAACYMKIEEFDLAAADAVRSIEFDALNWKSYSKAINCFLLLGNINQAENYIEKLQNNIPGVDSIKFDEIPKLERLKECDTKIRRCYDGQFYAECLTNIEEAFKIAKFSISYRIVKVYCLIMLDRIPEADLMIEIFQKNPKSPYAFYLLGLKFYRLGKLKTSGEKLETCLSIVPDLKPAQDLRAKVRKISELYQKGKNCHFAQTKY